MSNYYYFASDEEYQYALEHGLIKKATNFFKSTARKITIDRKKKQIAKTPVNAGTDLSEARSEHLSRNRLDKASTNEKEIKKRQSRVRAIQSKVNPESIAKRKAYADKNNKAQYKRTGNKYKSVEQTRKNSEVHDYTSFGTGVGQLKNGEVTNYKFYPSEEADADIARYREKHPGTTLSEKEIARRMGYDTNRI